MKTNTDQAKYNAFVFGSRLYAIRRAKDLTVTQISEESGIDASQLHYYEAGTRKPGLENLMLLCVALDCTPNDLLLESTLRTETKV